MRYVRTVHGQRKYTRRSESVRKKMFVKEIKKIPNTSWDSYPRVHYQTSDARKHLVSFIREERKELSKSLEIRYNLMLIKIENTHFSCSYLMRRKFKLVYMLKESSFWLENKKVSTKILPSFKTFAINLTIPSTNDSVRHHVCLIWFLETLKISKLRWSVWESKTVSRSYPRVGCMCSSSTQKRVCS